MTSKIDVAALALDNESRNIDRIPEGKVATLTVVVIALGQRLPRAASKKESGLFSCFMTVLQATSKAMVS